MVSPITWTHHLIWLLPTLAWLTLAKDRPYGGRWLAAFAAVMFWMAPVWFDPATPYAELHEHSLGLLASNAYFYLMVSFLLGIALLLAVRTRRARRAAVTPDVAPSAPAGAAAVLASDAPSRAPVELAGAVAPAGTLELRRRARVLAERADHDERPGCRGHVLGDGHDVVTADRGDAPQCVVERADLAVERDGVPSRDITWPESSSPKRASARSAWRAISTSRSVTPPAARSSTSTATSPRTRSTCSGAQPTATHSAPASVNCARSEYTWYARPSRSR